jgi:hypothetical protein
MYILGDTTAFTLSWFMKEIHHKDNKHLDSANKIRAEAEELGFTSTFLGYGDAPVRQHRLGARVNQSDVLTRYLEENAICECHVG